MATSTIHRPVAARSRRAAAVLSSGCDGYVRGTTGRVVGTRHGCVVFAPDEPQRVARWAVARKTLLVPPAFVVRLGG